MTAQTPPPRTPPQEAPAEAKAHNDALEAKLTTYGKVFLVALTLVLASAAGMMLGAPGVILVLAGSALVFVIVIFWSSVRTLLGETPLSGADAYMLGAPRAEEEQKRAVLRALKDLEFERSVGKLSEEDYQALAAQYRAEAKRLLRLLDEKITPQRERAEELVRKRLRREGLLDAGGDAYRKRSTTPAKDPKDEVLPDTPDIKEGEVSDSPAPTAEAARKPKSKKSKRARAAESAEAKAPSSAASAEEQDATRLCAACGTNNDADAIFCKKCGARQVKKEAELLDAAAVSAKGEAT